MTSTTVGASDPSHIQQNWVIDQLSDGLLIIVAPLISLVWAVAVASWFGADVVLVIFAVFNIAHHLPTFIRIYGDRDLLRRFRWSLLLGPVLPFSLAMCVVSYVALNGYPMINVLYLMLILFLWDPWHFLRQHYGFMRIYDRNSKVRRSVSSRMDFMICGTWFVYIMLATLDWLPDLLYDAHQSHGLPLLFLFDGGVYDVVQLVGLCVALAGTVAYSAYLVWCRANDYYVSSAKIALMIITFGVMYLTYVPNPLISGLVPNWNFALGFAVLGMVHVTQYLAIVWKYNLRLAQRDGAARPGIFQKFFSRGDWNAASLFVIVCLLYGCLLAFPSTILASRNYVGHSIEMGAKWFEGVIFALGFTSTLMHYYYDGFIWKLRHKENQEYLGILPTESMEPPQSWWEGSSRSTASGVFLRQCLYFVPPILLLSVTFWFSQENSIRSQPIGHAVAASNMAEAESSISAMEDQMEVEAAMLQIRPRAKHLTYQADLFYITGVARAWAAEQRGATGDVLREERRRSLTDAVASMERALELGPPYGHIEDPEMTREGIEERLHEWRLELQEI